MQIKTKLFTNSRQIFHNGTPEGQATSPAENPKITEYNNKLSTAVVSLEEIIKNLESGQIKDEYHNLQTQAEYTLNSLRQLPTSFEFLKDEQQALTSLQSASTILNQILKTFLSQMPETTKEQFLKRYEIFRLAEFTSQTREILRKQLALTLAQSIEKYFYPQVKAKTISDNSPILQSLRKLSVEANNFSPSKPTENYTTFKEFSSYLINEITKLINSAIPAEQAALSKTLLDLQVLHTLIVAEKPKQAPIKLPTQNQNRPAPSTPTPAPQPKETPKPASDLIGKIYDIPNFNSELKQKELKVSVNEAVADYLELIDLKIIKETPENKEAYAKLMKALNDFTSSSGKQETSLLPNYSKNLFYSLVDFYKTTNLTPNRQFQKLANLRYPSKTKPTATAKQP